MMEEKKVTIYDVAEEAGVSIATVSRYLNNKGVVAKKSEEKIVAAIDKLNYTPDAAAQKLASGQSKAIGLLMREKSLFSDYYSEFLCGAYSALRQEDYDILLMSDDADVKKLEAYVRKEKKVDGIIAPFIRDPEKIRYLLKRKIPYVYAGKRLEFDIDGHNVYGGFSDYRKAVANCFIEHHCKKMLVIDISERDSERSASVFSEFSDHLEIEQVVSSTQLEDDVYRFLIKRLKEADRPDCIFFSACEWTSQVYLAAAACGLEIGKDIKLISSVHAAEKRIRFVPDLTVVFIDARKMGYQAGLKMLQLINGEKPDKELTDIPFQMLLNESV